MNFTQLKPEPMAAWGGEKSKAEFAFIDPNYVAQTKYDGARYVIKYDLDGEVLIYSRHRSVKTGDFVDKTRQLRHIAEQVKAIFPRGTILDGEVVANAAQSSSNLVTRVTGASADKALATQEAEGFLKYVIFDMLAYCGEDVTGMSQRGRWNGLIEWLPLPKNGHIEWAGYVEGEAAKRALYTDIVARGGEGIILKDLRAPYFPGKRNKSWVKVKKERTFDVVFMGVEAAKETSIKSGDAVATKTKFAGQAGAIKFGQYVMQGFVPVLTELGTVSGFDDTTRLDLTENHQVYTAEKRVFEVRAQEQFESGALRHPRFIQWRPDKSADTCVLRIGEA